MKKTKKKKETFKGVVWKEEDKKTLAEFLGTPTFSITLTIGNKIYKGQGENPLEALETIPKPDKIMSKGTFFMTDGVKKTAEVLMYPIRLRRLFYNKIAREIQLKSLCLGMK